MILGLTPNWIPFLFNDPLYPDLMHILMAPDNIEFIKYKIPN